MVVALVTGVSRRAGIGHAVAQRLTADGITVAAAGLTAYDDRMPWGADGDRGRRHDFDADFADPRVAERLVGQVGKTLGPVDLLVLCHCESVDSDIRTTTVESFDRHMAVNARATWQLIRAFADQFVGQAGTGRIISITSDHTAGNLPYGASKAAMDRIVLASAIELKDLGVTANVINPGATDTGWMSPEIEHAVLAGNLQPRLGQPTDVANLVSFLCSDQGGWINGQLLYSNGGRG